MQVSEMTFNILGNDDQKTTYHIHGNINFTREDFTSL